VVNNYKVIAKDAKNQPGTGVYTDWKEQIAKECFHQCVYCTIHENQWGGIDHYHIDHFRPKSIARFAKLENDILNLFYACPVCNRFKSNDWPADPDLNVISYPDPSKTDYNAIFDFDASNFVLVGKHVSSNYLIERLYLNRPQLVYERKEEAFKKKETELINQINQLVQKSTEMEIMKKAMQVVTDVRNHLSQREKIRPYKLAEIRKP
jgi:hypothetical protein